MDYIDISYIRQLSPQLNKFKDKGNNTFNARCPVCGDSSLNPNKARFWFFPEKVKTRVHCFNCGYSSELSWFLKDYYPNLYKEYQRERFGSRSIKSKEVRLPSVPKPIFKPKPLNLKSIKDLSVDHPARLYVTNRFIPEDKLHLLYIAPKFKAWSHEMMPEKYTYIKQDEPRLIIPFFDRDHNLIAFQGRSFDPRADVKYITIKIQDTVKLFGQERINNDTDIIIVEGPLDSLFLDNSLAMAGSAVKDVPYDKDKVIFAFDREPRNKEIVKAMHKKIKQGYRVCIADNLEGGKDINDWIKARHTPKQIQCDIIEHTYQGMEAELKLTEWRKC